MINPKQMIVQSWRPKSWRKIDPDSILILQFSEVAGGGQIDLVHVNVPRHDFAVVKKGWPKYYWTPWKAHLKRKSGKTKPVSVDR
ncbi:MAG: SRPBCC domain-containing protein [Nitrospiraceae bacterium]